MIKVRRLARTSDTTKFVVMCPTLDDVVAFGKALVKLGVKEEDLKK